MNQLQEHDAELLQELDWLIGIDEAGRGCLAGPVVAGACVLADDFFLTMFRPWSAVLGLMTPSNYRQTRERGSIVFWRTCRGRG